MITNLDFVAIPSQDAERLRPFYADTLGLRPGSEGVEFTGDTIDTGVCHMVLFTDPDGNDLMLHHRYAPRE